MRQSLKRRACPWGLAIGLLFLPFSGCAMEDGWANLAALAANTFVETVVGSTTDVLLASPSDREP